MLYCPLMAERVPLLQVLQGLPARQEPITPRASDGQFSTRSTIPSDFVWPDVRLDSSTAPILLITAPGAMGKSYTSRAIAQHLAAPRLDLSGVRVGANTLTGKLFSCLDPLVAADYLQELSKGQAALILDGVDEAQLLAGREHFLAFLQDVAALLSKATDNSQVIMLGRPDSMLVTETALYEYGVSCVKAELTPLARPQAVEIVGKALDKKMQGGRLYQVHRTHPEPFGRLRDAVWRDLAAALGATAKLEEEGWAQVEDFLGYPPVLLAIAARLAVDNPQDEINRVTSDRVADRRAERGKLLRRVVEDILDREADKVRRQITVALGLAPNDPRIVALYTRSEQVLRVLSLVTASHAAILSPAVLTQSERAIYEEQVPNFVQDHPLILDGHIANVVFADYVRAFLHAADDAELHGLSKPVLLARCQPVGPFFVHFMLGLTANADLAVGEIGTEALVKDLVRSHVSGSPARSVFVFSHDADGATLTLLAGGYASRRPDTAVTFRVSDPSGVLELDAPLGGGYIVSDHALVIASNRDETEIGPDLTVVVDELQLGGQMLFVASAPDAGAPAAGAREGVTLIARVVGHSPKLSVTVAGSLAVGFDDVTYQWLPYRMTKSPLSGKNLPKLSQLVVATRRLLVAFRQGFEEPILQHEMLERLVVGSSKAGHVALTALLNLDIISRQGTNYSLVVANLQPFGVNYGELRGPNFADHLSALVAEMSADEAVKKFLDLR